MSSKQSLSSSISVLAGLLLTIALPGTARAQPEQLASFSGNYGTTPQAGPTLVQGPDGQFYGTTQYGGILPGGIPGSGTFFTLNPDGTITTLHAFGAAGDGEEPVGALVHVGGDFYGTTRAGGTFDLGTVFKVTPGGEVTILHHFNGENGREPHAALMLGGDGAFYGTTRYGGEYDSDWCFPYRCGTVFRITPTGTFTRLHSFQGPDGAGPGAAHLGAGPGSPLVLGSDGNLYGTTADGGSAWDHGTVFRIGPQGGLPTTLHVFQSYNTDDSRWPNGLVLGPDGALYGTTTNGGRRNVRSRWGAIFRMNIDGSNFAILHTFGEQTGDGRLPRGQLALGCDGNMYGLTEGGQFNLGCRGYGCGTLFSVTLAGALTTLHTFTGPDGDGPAASLVQATDGHLHGTTRFGGLSSVGNVFRWMYNQAPQAADQPVSTLRDTPRSIVLTATDPDGDPLTYDIVSPPTSGALSGTAPTVTYTPAAGYTGMDSFTFKARDRCVESNLATVTLTVTAPPPGTPALSVADTSVVEGNAGTALAEFSVTLSAPSTGTVTVDYATADDTATVADGDYLPASGTLTFPPGVVTQPVAVSVVGDLRSENEERFTLVLSNPVNASLQSATARGLITNDDGGQGVDLSLRGSAVEPRDGWIPTPAVMPCCSGTARTPGLGPSLTFHFSVTNLGSSPASGVTLTVTIPDGHSYRTYRPVLPATWSCPSPKKSTTQLLVCSLAGPILAGGRAEGELVFRVNRVGPAKYEATVSSMSPDSNPTDNSRLRFVGVLPGHGSFPLGDSSHLHGPAEVDPSLPTVVFTHGLQAKSDLTNNGGLASDIRVLNTLWTGNYDKQARNLLALRGTTAGANVLSFVWEEAFQVDNPTTLPTRDEYVAAQRSALWAGARLAGQLLSQLCGDYTDGSCNYRGKIHFVGHSLGSVVSSYATWLFLIHAPNAEVAQLTVLDRPEHVNQLLDATPSSTFETNCGFDGNFVGSVLENIVAVRPSSFPSLLVDNYYAEGGLTSVAAAGDKALGSSHVPVKDFSLSEPRYVAYYIPDDLFLNDHSGVHQWYRLTMKTDISGVDFCDGSEWANGTPDGLNDTLIPCERGWYWSLLESSLPGVGDTSLGNVVPVSLALPEFADVEGCQLRYEQSKVKGQFVGKSVLRCEVCLP